MTVGQEFMERQSPDALLGARGVAALLDCTPRYVTEQYALSPGFPKAIRLTGPGGRRGQPKWQRGDITAWIETHKGGKSKRGGRPRNT